MYDGPPTSPVDVGGDPLDRDCTRCVWSAGPGKACLPAHGDGPGGLLVVGDSPVRDAQRPFASKSGAYVRTIVSKHWRGHVVYDYAVKCPAKAGAKMKDAAKPIKECRSYLAKVVQSVRPQRVLAVGAWAISGLLGRGLDMESARRGYGWVLGDVPVFYVHQPVLALENRFYKSRWEDDVEWALTCARPRPSHVHGVVHVVEDLADAHRAAQALAEFPELLFDVETAGVPHDSDFTVLCAGLSPVDELEGDSWVWSQEALGDQVSREYLRQLLTTKMISGSNIKYDAICAIRALGIDIREIRSDTQLLRKLMEPTAMGRLEYAAELVGQGGHKEEAQDALKKAVRAAQRKTWRVGEKPHDHWCVQAIKLGKDSGQYKFGLLPDDLLWRYNGRDCATSAAAVIHLRAQVEKRPNENACWESLYRPAINSFRRIECTGMRADRPAFEQFSQHLNLQLDELREHFKGFGKDFNPNAPQQVARILYDKLGLPIYERSDKSGDPSTDASVLERLRGMHPFVDHMLEWRRLSKLDGTYARGMLSHILSDGRIHTTFRLDGTETLRISSENPNSQNLPRAETAEGKMVRDGFIASPGKVLIELDQSQIELRVAAGRSGDPEMMKIFTSGLDYHLRTAQLISRVAWNIAEDAVTDWHRSHAKIVNFSLVYGKTDQTLAQEIGCSVDDARRIRLAILGRFKLLDRMLKKDVHFARTHGYIEIPWFGEAIHVRPIFEAGSHDKWKRNHGDNMAMNCLDAETEALTQRGWIKGFDLQRDDVLLTKNPRSGELEWQGMTDLKLWPDYEGPMVEFKSKSFHAVSTPDHRWLVHDKSSGGDIEKTTRTLSQWGDHRIHRTGDYRAASSDLTEDEAELLGWFVTDGSIKRASPARVGKRGPKKQAGGLRAFLVQSMIGNPSKCARIDALLARLGGPLSRRTDKYGEVFWNLGIRLTERLLAFAPQRALTVDALLKLSRPALERLRESMMLGDGTTGTKDVFFTGRQEQAEAFQVLCTLTGNATTTRWLDMSKYTPRASLKMRNIPKSTGVWAVTILRRDTTQVVASQRSEVITKCPVWCPMVPNTFFVARRSGTVYITGNSPIQGRAACYTLASIPLLHEWIDASNTPAEIVNTVHDSIMLETEPEYVDAVIENGSRIMQSFDCWGVPLVADAKAGDRWGSLRKIKRGEKYKEAQVRWTAEALKASAA